MYDVSHDIIALADTDVDAAVENDDLIAYRVYITLFRSVYYFSPIWDDSIIENAVKGEFDAEGA